MKSLTAVILFFFLLVVAKAQKEDSANEQLAGFVITNDDSLLMVLFLSKNDSGLYIENISIPDQLVYNLKPSRQSFRNDSLFFEISKAGAKYKGKYDSHSGSLKGKWTQAKKDFQLDFSKTDKDYSIKRPQTPLKPYPYSEEEITFINPKDGVELSGTITIPEGKGPFPAVVIVNGSGQQERDCEIMGHKWALVLADHLTRQGIVTFRYDDRGTGKSGGNPFNATTLTFAEDAAAAYMMLRKHKSADINMTGIIGHSEGGIIAPVVASKIKDVSFLVLLAAPGIDVSELMVIQNRRIIENENILRPEQFQGFETMIRTVYKTILKTPDNNEARKKVLMIYSAYAKTIDSLQVIKLKINEKNLNQQLVTMLSPWYRKFLSIKPSEYNSKVKCPVLALNGSLDMQVTADENLAAISDSYRSSGNTNLTVKKLTGLNHLFQPAITGMPEEYSRTEQTISTEVLDIISNWIKKH